MTFSLQAGYLMRRPPSAIAPGAPSLSRKPHDDICGLQTTLTQSPTAACCIVGKSHNITNQTSQRLSYLSRSLSQKL